MRIAIAGYGVEGKANYRYWNTPENDVVIVDERDIPTEELPVDASIIIGKGAYTRLDGFDLVIRTASLPPRAIKTDGTVWSATNEFFSKCPVPIIGVTGTKGKGTTSSLIASILRASGRTVHLLGNIGTPALAELANIQRDHIVVFELSSFQLWDMERSPHVAVVLGIEPDHLDVHGSMQDYVDAKARITIYQSPSDTLVYNQTNAIAQSIADVSKAEKVAYMNEDILQEFADALAIPGRHNVENAAAAIAATEEYVTNKDTIRQGLSSFKGLPHRIKLVRERDGVRYYDDSYSSSPTASIAALRSFDAPKVVVLGGYEKFADFTELANHIASDSSVKHAVLIGQTAHRIAKVFEANGVSAERYSIDDTRDLESIVKAIQLDKGDILLLSPGSASFDMFKNFTDRGERFTRIVESL